MPQINPDQPLLAGSLSSRRRTIVGVIGQFALLGLDAQALAGVLSDAGLPARALDDPDFPISVDQELHALARGLDSLVERQQHIALYALKTFEAVGINHYGVLGLAMQHAPTVTEALANMLAFPELAWGHSRIVGALEDERFVLRFELGAEVPAGLSADVLREYCVTTDLASLRRRISDLTGGAHSPIEVTLPFRVPPEGERALAGFPYPVRFDQPAAELRYRANLVEAAPVLANALPYLRYRKLAENFSHMLAEEVPVAEQVTRLLWGVSPAPSRDQIADMLGVSGRTLARRLRNAGTSFAALHRSVQLERASNFLRQSSMPVAEVAERLGYSDAAAFTRAFQSWTGAAPSQWRKQARTAGSERTRSPASPLRDALP